MAVFFTSDLHFGHESILSIRTQFHDIDEHDGFLIEKWNKKVKRNDEVYILGNNSFICTFQCIQTSNWKYYVLLQDALAP